MIATKIRNEEKALKATKGFTVQKNEVFEDKPMHNRFRSKSIRTIKRQQKLLETERFKNSSIHHNIAFLEKKTHFDKTQIKSLLAVYAKLASMSKLDRSRFREVLDKTFDLSDDFMLDRIFEAIDGDHMGSINESEWVIGLSIILRGTLEEQTNFVYEVYDVNGDNSIGREELLLSFRGCIHPIPGWSKDDNDELTENGAHDMVDLAMKKLDLDHDGHIKIGEFSQAVNQDPLLLQALGPCLPTAKAMKTFLYLFDMEYEKFSESLSHPNDMGWHRERERHRFNGNKAAQYKKYHVEFKSVFDRKHSIHAFMKKFKVHE